MKWRNDYVKKGEFSTIETFVTVAHDFIEEDKETSLKLVINHVKGFHGHGFVSIVRNSDGHTCQNGEIFYCKDEEAYQKSLKEGEANLKRLVAEFLKESAKL